MSTGVRESVSVFVHMDSYMDTNRWSILFLHLLHYTQCHLIAICTPLAFLSIRMDMGHTIGGGVEVTRFRIHLFVKCYHVLII